MKEFYIISKCLGPMGKERNKYYFAGSFAGFGVKIKTVIISSVKELIRGKEYILYVKGNVDGNTLFGEALKSKVVDEIKRDIL